jgi:coenzyme F420-dependent glucose-6-phosphate dehydrogenase
LYIAASGSKAIQTDAKYADGLISISKPDKTKGIFELFDKSSLQ